MRPSHIHHFIFYLVYFIRPWDCIHNSFQMMRNALLAFDDDITLNWHFRHLLYLNT
jgi:hypothetical protein